MSAINKKPYIQTVVESLTDEQLKSLASLINGSGETIFKSFINTSYPFSTSDKGVSRCILEAKDEIFTGYLLYNDTYCVLVAYFGVQQEMKILKLDYAHDNYEIVHEELTINEFRRVIEGTGAGGGGSGTEVVANPEGSITGGLLEKLKVGDETYSIDSSFPEINAPESTTLSESLANKIAKGCIIKGTFLGLKNLTLLPAQEESNGNKYGIAFGYDASFVSVIVGYQINSSLVISLRGATETAIALKSIFAINGQIVKTDMLKLLSLATPSDAATKTYAPKLVNGTWTLVAE